MRNLPGDSRFLSTLRWISTGAGISGVFSPLCYSYSCSLPQGVPAYTTSISMNTQERTTGLSGDFAEEHLLLTSVGWACLKISLPFSLGPLVSPVLRLLCVHGCPADTQGVSGHHILQLQQLLGGDTSPCVHAEASWECVGVSGSRAHLTHGTEQIQQGHLT